MSEISREEQLGLYIPEASLIAVDDINMSALSESFSDFQQLNGRDTRDTPTQR